MPYGTHRKRIYASRDISHHPGIVDRPPRPYSLLRGEKTEIKEIRDSQTMLTWVILLVLIAALSLCVWVFL